MKPNSVFYVLRESTQQNQDEEKKIPELKDLRQRLEGFAFDDASIAHSKKQRKQYEPTLIRHKSMRDSSSLHHRRGLIIKKPPTFKPRSSSETRHSPDSSDVADTVNDNDSRLMNSIEPQK